MHRSALLSILLSLMVGSFWPQDADAAKTSGMFFLKFLNYTNPKGKLANGNCCDGRWIFCERHGCDYKFRICFDTLPLNSNIHSCKIGRAASTQEIHNQNNVIFGSTIGNLRNPLKFHLTSKHLREGSAGLKVQVWDDDPGINPNDYVDMASITINLRRKSPTVYTLKSRTKLVIQTSVICANYLYGPTCDVQCKPRDDVGGHYTCAAGTGKKICRKGWKGAGCKTKVIQFDYCAGRPCRNHAKCINGVSGPKCHCRYGYTGRFCERHRCEQTCLPGRCSYGGPVHSGVDIFLPRCKCPSGYSSQKAKINFKTIYIMPKCIKRQTHGRTGRPQTTQEGTTTALIPETTTAPIQETTHVTARYEDCGAFVKHGASESGIFVIKVKGLPEFRAWCDVKADTGWALIQRRVDKSVSFNRNWAEYKKGFGVLGENTNYWMGLEKLHHLTTQKDYKLQVVFWETRKGKRSYRREAIYEQFWVDSEDNKYQLHVRNYSGNAGDALGYHNGEAFSTPERDNDKLKWGGNCAKLYKCGWWFKRCYRANLNGQYTDPQNWKSFLHSYHKIAWLSKPGSIISNVSMKVAPSGGSLSTIGFDRVSFDEPPFWR